MPGLAGSVWLDLLMADWAVLQLGRPCWLFEPAGSLVGAAGYLVLLSACASWLGLLVFWLAYWLAGW
jgi:hypothetical protein